MSVVKKLTEAVRQYGSDKAIEILQEGIDSRLVRPQDISIRALAESLMGPLWHSQLERANRQRLTESTMAVDASAFTAITGQLLINEIKQKYQIATLVTDALFSKEPITNGNLGPQRVPWLSDVTSEGKALQAGEVYPRANFEGQYIDYPAPLKRGRMCQVTMEAIFSDLTTQILDSAGSVGRRLGLQMEEDRLKVLLGLVNNHNWNGSAYNTYLGAGTDWINSDDALALTDYTSIQELELLASQTVDPVTGKNIQIDLKHLFVMPKLRYTAKRIMQSTEIRVGDITTGTGTQTVSANPLDMGYQIFSSPHARRLLIESGVSASVADTYWFLGDMPRAFVWREVYPLTTVQAPPQNVFEFEQDVALSVKAGFYGVAAVKDPRYVYRGYVA